MAFPNADLPNGVLAQKIMRMAHAVKRDSNVEVKMLSRQTHFRRPHLESHIMDERTYYEQGNVSVTNARFVSNGQTFAIRNITAVETGWN